MLGDLYHPVFLNLRGRKVLIVGGGEIAAEKVRSLLHSGADITLVAPSVIEPIRLWSHEGVLTWVEREFLAEDVDSAFMSIGATDDIAVNRTVADLAEAQNSLGNSVDDPKHCNFIMAAIARQASMQVAISSSGNSPALAQRVRDRIQKEILTEDIGGLADFLGTWRPEVGRSLPTYQARKAFWEFILDSDIPAILAHDGRESADKEMRRTLLSSSEGTESAKTGKVFLVGAGPGDPKLLTVRALELLQIADIVLYDRLVNPEILALCSAKSECLYVGKSLGTPGKTRQDAINAFMIEHARAGKQVVRLKGGDPFVFGRGGEEMLALAAACVAFEVVPGISSAISVPASVHIPITHRGISDAFAVFTGQTEDGSEEGSVSWPFAAKIPTAVFLMGLDRLPAIVANLTQYGRAADCPIAVIADGTLPTERVVIGTLETILELSQGLTSPAVIVIGEVVRLPEMLQKMPNMSHIVDNPLCRL